MQQLSKVSSHMLVNHLQSPHPACVTEALPNRTTNSTAARRRPSPLASDGRGGILARLVVYRAVCLLLLCTAAIFTACPAMAAGALKPTGEAQFLANIRQLTYEGNRSGEGYFSPDGRELILQSEREPTNPFYQIYVLNLASGDTHRVSPGLGKTTCAFFRPR